MYSFNMGMICFLQVCTHRTLPPLSEWAHNALNQCLREVAAQMNARQAAEKCRMMPAIALPFV